MTNYVAKTPDQTGFIHYSPEENSTWEILYERQVKIVETRACKEFIEGIKTLNMPTHRIPQLKEVTEALRATTGWSVVQVPAMITPDEFFQLLTQKQFPAATFIRRPEELDYLEEPDIFHELFGHCPLITHTTFADFLQKYGEMALRAPEKHHALIARLFWFTVEFGLMQTPEGLRCYGGGILSSKNETIYALENSLPKRVAFDILDVLRTPYRVDQIQGLYFVIQSFEELYDVLNHNLHQIIEEALHLPENPLIEVNNHAIKDSWFLC